MTHQELWAAYRAANSDAGEEYEAWAYVDEPDALAELTRTGVKTATASAGPLYELEGEPLPQPGAYSVVLDSRGQAVCVIRTTNVYTVPFDQVSEEQAYREGEGDRSLDYWRRVHEDFFRAELAEAGLEFWPEMPVVCEEFEMVFGLGEGGAVKDIGLVIRTLTELSGWLENDPAREGIENIIGRLEHYPALSREELEKIKHMLSREMLFHIRWLGDRVVPGFVGDGTTYAWWNYLLKIAEICQENL